MNSAFFNSLYLDQESRKPFKVTLFVALSNILAMTWDLFGLKTEPSLSYLSLKIFFLLTPSLLFFVFKEQSASSKRNTLVAITYYAYCLYNTAYVDQSYYTSFMQFFFGQVYFLRFSTRDFFIAHGVGLSFYTLALLKLKSTIPAEDYAFQLQLMNGATLPIFGISVLIFFYIKRQEGAERAKSVFFETIGRDVGFILHEIKQPLLKISSQKEDQNIEDLNELLETANIMWPSQTSEVHLESVPLKELCDDILNDLKRYTDHMELTIENQIPPLSVTAKRSFLKIILKNLLKNAIEEAAKHQGHIKLSFEDPLKFIMTNTIESQVNTRHILKAGVSYKSGAMNRGLGLYISKQLCEKMQAKLSVSATKNHFKATLTFSDKEV
ncbi:MAG: HAMP domain-containing sensor histidine kinase [Bdellovibrionota bacterium]|nr:HAMP domain-containing sensor histidine kinase [Bdellovibrionota bacterium]